MRSIASKLKDFVNCERQNNEDAVSFYCNKLRLGIHCDLPDHVITVVIISTLNNNLLKASAQVAGCKITKSLLKFLVESNYSLTSINKPERQNQGSKQNQRSIQHNVKCFTCGKTGHKSKNCYQNKTKSSNSTTET